MLNPEFYRWLEELTAYDAFQETLSVTERLQKERYDMELALRFVILVNETIEELKKVRDVGDYITKKMCMIASCKEYDQNRMSEIFKRTFSVIYNCLQI